MSNALKRGDLVLVRNEDSDPWSYAYISHFNESNGHIHVMAGGRNLWSEKTKENIFTKHYTQEDLDYLGDIAFLLNTVSYKQYSVPVLENLTPSTLPNTVQNVEREDLYYGMPILVRYEENEPWSYEHLARFWTDGRVEVIPNGQTPFTRTNGFGHQPHQADEGEREHTFPTVTYNFWKLPHEITDSGDLRETDQFKTFWFAERLTHKDS